MRRLIGSGFLVLLAACATAAPSGTSSASADSSACPEGTLASNGSCASFLSESCTLPALPNVSDVQLAVDQVYTTPYRGQSYAAPQGLDVARPKSGTNAPVALFVHGGGWNGGSKADHRDDIVRMAGHGWVAVSVDYRLVQDHWKNRFPAAISDVRCAVRWVRTHATELGADPTRIVALGDSAGGELVELLGTAPTDTSLDDSQCELSGDTSVKAVVAYYGRADLSVPPLPDYLVDYIGRDGDWTSRQTDGSPIKHVSASTVPMLLIHGQNDGTVPIAQSRAMRDALRGAGVPVGLMELPGEGHGFPMFGTSGTETWGACTTATFLDAVTSAPAPAPAPTPPTPPGAACSFNVDCPSDQRCECSDDTGCACAIGARGTAKAGEPCQTGDDCTSALCLQGPNNAYVCSDQCTQASDCPPNLPLCQNISFVGQICTRQP